MFSSQLKPRCFGIVQKSIQSQRIPQRSLIETRRFISDYIEQQEKKGRPLSPHVTAYRFPVVAISSVTNRITGVALTGGLYGIGALALVGLDVPSFMQYIGTSSIGPMAKFVVTFPLIYHYFGAVRHTYWDLQPESLLNKEVEMSSYILFGASGAVSVIASVL
mmetsp:Transcript_3338/g.5193  ORF Transcript_3338/g.5193 Transcript_3338/m.5193 type:complete len:163 (-) Transcript_3338:24-512(-)